LEDNQLKVDVKTDKIIFDHLANSELIAEACSEESPQPVRLQENGAFCCAFDPLDGSSIYSANLSVGSIVSVWRGSSLLNQKVKDQSLACFAIYGPKTICIVAYNYEESRKCTEVTLFDDEWKVTRESIALAPVASIFSPANLRAINENSKYNQMIAGYITKEWTLRYIGGLVPDVYHIIAKGQGIHSNVHSANHKAKLRLLFEVAAMAFIIDAAKGSSFSLDEAGLFATDILELTIHSYEQCLSLVIGSTAAVDEARLIFQ
jgi:sedoheptulose-bisphosphatase